MRQRRFLRALASSVIGLTALTSLVACGSGGSGGGKVTLTYGIWDKDQQPAMQQIIAAFEKQNPDISVNIQLTAYTSYFTKLQVAASGGQASDVFWMNGPNFQLYASNGMLEPLTDLHPTLSDYPSSLVKLYQYHGTQYGVPKDFDTVGLWYNKKLFDAAGVAYPTANWTWADFNNAAARLTDKQTGVYGAAAQLEGQEDFYNTIFQAGGYVISPNGRTSGYDTPADINGLEFWTNLIRNGYSPTLQQMTDTVPLNMFESGKVAMFWGGSWDAEEFGDNTYTKANVDVTALPSDVRKATVIHGLSNVVNAHGAHLAQAEKFEQFLGSQQAAQLEAGTGTVIPAFNGTQQPWVKAWPEFDLQSFLDQLPYAVPLPSSANTAAWNNLETTLLPKAWDLTEPVPVVAQQLATQMTSDLAKEGS